MALEKATDKVFTKRRLLSTLLKIPEGRKYHFPTPEKPYVVGFGHRF
jgi:hypothetical protein